MSGRPRRGLHQRRRHLAFEDAQLGEGGAVVAGVGAGAPVPLDGEHRARRAHRVGQGDGEEAGAGVEVRHRCSLARPDEVQDRVEERRRRAGVDLPEDPGRNPVGAATDDGMHGAGRTADLPADHDAGADVGQARRGAAARRDRDHRLRRVRAGRDLELGGAGPQDGEGTGRGDRRAGDGALVDVFDPVGAVPPEAHRATPVHRDPHPAAIAQARRVAGNRFHLDRPLESRPAAPAARRCGTP